MKSLVTENIRRIALIFVTLVILGACITSPVLAGTKYMSGSPNFTVTIAGSNDFTPGETATLKLMVQNSGLNNMKIVQSSIVDRDDEPNTAKMVKVTLSSGDSPILVKSDPQMIGDVAGSASVPAEFQIRIPDSAQAGVYMLPVTLDYTYLSNADQEGTDSIVYRYTEKTKVIELPLIVKPAINMYISNVTCDNVNAGGSGFVTLNLTNTGLYAGDKAIVHLSRSGASPVIPVDSTVYLGTFEPGSSVSAKFKVSVSTDAEPQEYPLNVLISYNNDDGETIETPSQEFGIPVGQKIDFVITSETPEIRPGAKHVIDVDYLNKGSSTAYSAEIRISAVDPFSSNDDIAYVGDIGPGETGTARFELSVDSTATIKTYGLDSEVKYRDALDDSQISDTIKVPINIVGMDGSLLENPIFILVILVIIAGAGFFLYKRRQNKV